MANVKKSSLAIVALSFMLEKYGQATYGWMGRTEQRRARHHSSPRSSHLDLLQSSPDLLHVVSPLSNVESRVQSEVVGFFVVA